MFNPSTQMSQQPAATSLMLQRAPLEPRQVNVRREIGISPPRGCETFSAAVIRRQKMEKLMSRSEGDFSPMNANYYFEQKLELPLNQVKSPSSVSSLFQHPLSQTCELKAAPYAGCN